MAKRGGFPGGMGMGNMNNLMKQAQKMQRQMEESQRSWRKRSLLLPPEEVLLRSPLTAKRR